MNRLLKIWVVPVLAFSPLAHCQTNSSSGKTNAIISSTNSVPSLAARKKQFTIAINSIFDLDYDVVEDRTKISFQSRQLTDTSIQMDLLCVISKSRPVPDGISILFCSYNEDWQFLRNSDLTIRWDDTKKSFGELKDDGRVRDDGTVAEFMWVDLTLEDFKAIAFAKHVNARLGSKTFEISSANRVSWKLISNYIDILKEERDANISNLIEDKGAKHQ